MTDSKDYLISLLKDTYDREMTRKSDFERVKSPTYEGHYYFDPEVDDEETWISPVTSTLSELINHGVDRVKQGRNPFRKHLTLSALINTKSPHPFI